MLYDYNGNVILRSKVVESSDNMELDYAYDPDTSTEYSIIRVYKTKKDGSTQTPFIKYYQGDRRKTYDVAARGWDIVTNAGLGRYDQVHNGDVEGPSIENGIIINDAPAIDHTGAIPMYIDKNGDLHAGKSTDTASELIQAGAVFSTCGFCPVIIDYEKVEIPAFIPGSNNSDPIHQKAQRTLLGQFGNGDYAIIGSAGRNESPYENSIGWSVADAQTVCKKLGLKFAYCMDGGTSTSVYLYNHPVYNFMLPTKTRTVPSFIVFNGTNKFQIP